MKSTRSPKVCLAFAHSRDCLLKCKYYVKNPFRNKYFITDVISPFCYNIIRIYIY